VTVPSDPAPSGTLLRVGVRSDLPEFVYGPPGQRWIVASAGRAEILRGPLRFRPEGAAAGGFQVQAGAFSQKGPAREREERLAAQFGVAGTVAFSADRGVYRVLLGSFPDRPAAEALAATLRSAGEEATAVEGRAAAPAAAPAAVSNVTVEDGAAAVFARRHLSGRRRCPRRPRHETVRGSLRVSVNPRGLVTVINRLDLEEYLYGVVPPRWDQALRRAEALKAQTVRRARRARAPGAVRERRL
jgi:hypothetical protein